MSFILKWLRSTTPDDRQRLAETELQPSEDYKMAQSFSGDDITDAVPTKDGGSEATSLSRASSYQKLNNTAPKTPDQKDVESEPEKQGSSSLSSASFNFINSIIGSGVIGIPYAMHQAGFGLGIVLIIVVAAFTDYSIVLLIQGGNLANTNTYQGLVNTAFGRTGFLILTAMQFLYPFIAMISYNIIIGDTITKVLIRLGGDSLVHTALGSRQFVIVIVTIIITLPLSLFKDVSKISKASLVSLILIAFILLTMLVKAILLKDSILYVIGMLYTKLNFRPPTPDAWQFAHGNFTQAIGILSFAYMCHHNSFLLYTSLENPTEQRWNRVTHASVLTSMIVTLLFGVLGYVTFTGLVQGDVLLNYCDNDDFINVARFAYAMTIVLTWPIECFVTREVVENSIFATKEPQLGRHILVTVIITILTCGLSMATDCLGTVLEFNGILAAIPLAFIFPPLCVLRLQQEPILSISSIPKLATAAFGILSAIIGTVMTIINLANGYTCSHGVTPPYCDNSTEITNSTLYVNYTSTTAWQTSNISTTLEPS